MTRSVAPLNVSPCIKTLRWTFFILGIFYGVNRLRSLRTYEEKAGPKRRHEIHERHLRLREEDRIRTRDELYLVGRDFEAEFEPGWDKEL